MNYAPGILPQQHAAQLGYAQNLWLHGPEHYITEVGTMNMFVVFRTDDGGAHFPHPNPTLSLHPDTHALTY